MRSKSDVRGSSRAAALAKSICSKRKASPKFLREAIEPRLLECWIVIIVEIVYDDDDVATLQQDRAVAAPITLQLR